MLSILSKCVRILLLAIYCFTSEMMALCAWFFDSVIFTPLISNFGLAASLFTVRVQLASGIAIGNKLSFLRPLLDLLTFEVFALQYRFFGGALQDVVCEFTAIQYGASRRFEKSQLLSESPSRLLNVEPTCAPQSVRGAAALDQPLLKTYLKASRDKKEKGYAGDEATCLQLNIWAPLSAVQRCNHHNKVQFTTTFSQQRQQEEGGRKTLLPVLVYFHGGAFVFGNCHREMENGKHLASRGNMVVVSCNYRLGSLGFLTGPGVTSNIGLRDQVIALEFVQKNIAQFGGDPEKVTVCGQSAGSMSCAFLLSIPGLVSSRRLFQQVINLSGGNQRIQTREQAHAVFGKFRAALKMEKEKGFSDRDVVEHMRKMDLCDLLRIQKVVEDEITIAYRNLTHSGLMPFCVTETNQDDDDLLFPAGVNPLETLEKNKIQCPVLASVTDNEYTFFTQISPSRRLSSAWKGIDETRLRDRIHQWYGKEGVTESHMQNLLDAYVRDDPSAARHRNGKEHPTWVALNSDYVFRVPTWNLADTLTKNGANVYVAIFADTNGLLPNAKAAHVFDVPYYFGSTLLTFPWLNGLPTPTKQHLSGQMMKAIIEFVHHGTPSGFERWNPATRPTRWFSTEAFSGGNGVAEGKMKVRGPVGEQTIYNLDCVELDCWRKVEIDVAENKRKQQRQEGEEKK